ncbi:T-box transcription factor TBX21 [Neoarius graeffei]|uniref:T-box transcription factor TBX21 n=1 Tax=Neoarius graeffei TaxID=443677 RepID=UPI00298C1D7E|nr:T-box transcription factor TBX21 [Neoarius graeffei]
MGGIGGSFYINMLNGSDAQSLAKNAETSGHLHRSKELVDYKMGVQDARQYYSDSVVNGQDNFPLPYHGEQGAGELGAQAGRFYSTAAAAAAPLGNCTFSRSSAVPAYAGADGYSPDSKDGYPASADSYHAHFQHGYPRAPLYSLPGLQVCGKTQVLLNNCPLWTKFHKYQTEMIITKQGRRMFPFLSFNISALDPSAHYNVYVDVVLADQHHWRYQGGKWVQCGKAEGNMPGNRMYMHPDSPNTGTHWMRQEVSFGKLKLTNNKGSSNNMAQMIVLQSLHKYQPRLHITEVKEDGTEDPFRSCKPLTFIFPETQFIAVTAYQNADITQLKIDHNPFAKGFRDNYDTLYAPPDSDRITPSPTEGQQLMAASCYPRQPYLPEQYISPLQHSRFYSCEPVSMAQGCPKDPNGSHHGRWYLPGQQGTPSNLLDFSSYEGDYTANSLYKPFPLQTSPHHPLSYYPENPFTSGPISSASPATWSTARPSPQYLSHPHPGKATSSLSWFCPMSSPAMSSSPPAVNSRLHPSPSLLESLRLPVPQDKSKEVVEDTWMETPSVKSVDSVDSGLFEGAESKKRRVSPYASSTENSPPIRSSEACEKDNNSDAGYYGFYSH